MKYPSYCCQKCGALYGWIGRLFSWIIPGYHTCGERGWDYVESE